MGCQSSKAGEPTGGPAKGSEDVSDRAPDKSNPAASADVTETADTSTYNGYGGDLVDSGEDVTEPVASPLKNTAAADRHEEEDVTDTAQTTDYGPVLSSSENTATPKTSAIVSAPPFLTPELPLQERRYRQFLSQSNFRAVNQASSRPRRPSSHGVQYSAYVATRSKALEELRAMEQADGWSLNRSGQGVNIYTKTEAGSPIVRFKADATLDPGAGGVSHILTCLLNVDDRPKWDKTCAEAKVIESYVPFYRITYVKQCSPMPGLIAQRDILIVSRLCFEEDGGFILLVESIEHPDVPEKPGLFRACLHVGGYIVRPIANSTKLKVVYTGSIDPKGWIPQFIVNAAAWKNGQGLAAFRDYVKQSLASGGASSL